MPFIVPKVVQYTVHGLFNSRPIANVISYSVDTTGSTLDRNTAIDQMCGVLLNEWDDSILPITSSLYSATSVSFVDLNSADGIVGSRTVSGAHTWPKAGGVAGATTPGNTAVLVRKMITSSRGARKGRIYLTGVPESVTDSANGNQLGLSDVVAYQTKMTSFLGDTNQSPGTPTTYESRMVVVHILTRGPEKPNGRPGDPLTGTSFPVSSLTVDRTLATQRRRLRK